MNQLQSVAMSEGLQRRGGLRSKPGRERLEWLPLAGWANRRRQDLLKILDRLNESVEDLTTAVQQEAEKLPEARLLMTHPGVGPVSALAFVLIIGYPGIFGHEFVQQVQAIGIEEVLSTPRSPCQRAYVERLIGTIRRECLDHVIAFNETRLRKHIQSFVDYYHRSRTHLSLQKDTPYPRPIQPSSAGPIIAIPEVGGLHHRYERRAAWVVLIVINFIDVRSFSGRVLPSC